MWSNHEWTPYASKDADRRGLVRTRAPRVGGGVPAVSERFQRLEETLQICLQMWSDNNGPYLGRHYQLAETLCRPVPVSSPRPRIMIGGGGERKTLRLVATYADSCNLMGTPDEVAHKLNVLREHCAAVDRDANEIEVTALFSNLPAEPSIDDVTRLAQQYAAVGVSTLIVGSTGDNPAAWLESRFAPTMDDLGDLEPNRSWAHQ